VYGRRKASATTEKGGLSLGEDGLMENEF